MMRHQLFIYSAFLELVRSGDVEIVEVSSDEWEEIIRRQEQRKIDEEAMLISLTSWPVGVAPKKPVLHYRADQYWTLPAKPPSSAKTDPHWISSEIRRRQAAYAKRLSNRPRPRKFEPMLSR